MSVHVIMLGVQDVARAKSFYADGLGCAVEQEYPGFVRLSLGEGSGFRGISFHHIVSSAQAVDEVMDKAVKAGASVVKAAEKAEWGGCDGYFSDPDGYLWKVASAQ